MRAASITYSGGQAAAASPDTRKLTTYAPAPTRQVFSIHDTALSRSAMVRQSPRCMLLLRFGYLPLLMLTPLRTPSHSGASQATTARCIQPACRPTTCSLLMQTPLPTSHLSTSCYAALLEHPTRTAYGDCTSTFLPPTLQRLPQPSSAQDAGIRMWTKRPAPSV